MKLYLWRSSDYMYFPGMAFAIASSIEEARKIIFEKYDNLLGLHDSINKEDPFVTDITDPFCFYQMGSE